MRILFLAYAICFGLLMGTSAANAACVANLGGDWRKVGASNNIKYVCKNKNCGGNGIYVFVKNLKARSLSSQAFLVGMKSGGRGASSPISGLSGIHKELTSKKGYRVIEIYYSKNKRGVDMIYVEALSSSKSTSRVNFAKAKKALMCR